MIGSQKKKPRLNHNNSINTRTVHLKRLPWGLNAIVLVESTRETGSRTETETRFYITSSTDHADRLAAVIRAHWAIENSLHWVMDMVFRDDECRISKGHAPANFTTVKHVAHNLMRRSPAKDSMRLKRKVAAWNDDFLASLIAQ
jgi:predicted transposase YbfD/YdcC